VSFSIVRELIVCMNALRSPSKQSEIKAGKCDVIVFPVVMVAGMTRCI
jgi:hypothetical protein